MSTSLIKKSSHLRHVYLIADLPKHMNIIDVLSICNTTEKRDVGELQKKLLTGSEINNNPHRCYIELELVVPSLDLMPANWGCFLLLLLSSSS